MEISRNSNDKSSLVRILEKIESYDLSSRVADMKYLAELLRNDPASREKFYQANGVPRILKYFWSRDRFTVYYALYVLSYASFNHAGNQASLCTERLFEMLSHLIKQFKYESLKSATNIMFLICCTVQENPNGQVLVRTTKCLKNLALIFPRLCQIILNHSKDQLDNTTMCWDIYCSCITICIGNSHITDNQAAVKVILPEALLFLTKWLDNIKNKLHLSTFVESLITMLPHILMNNDANKNQFAEFSGFKTITRGAIILEKMHHLNTELSIVLYKFIQLLNVAMMDNIENCKLVGSLGIIPLLLHLLLRFDNKLKISPLAAVANLIQSNRTSRREFLKGNGLEIITETMRNFDDDSEVNILSRHIRKYFSQDTDIYHRESRPSKKIKESISDKINNLTHGNNMLSSFSDASFGPSSRSSRQLHPSNLSNDISKCTKCPVQTEILISEGNHPDIQKDETHSKVLNDTKCGWKVKKTKILINSFQVCHCLQCMTKKASSSMREQIKQDETILDPSSKEENDLHYSAKHSDDEQNATRDITIKHLNLNRSVTEIPASSTPVTPYRTPITTSAGTSYSLETGSSSKRGEYLNFVIPLLPPRPPGETYSSLCFSRKDKRKLKADISGNNSAQCISLQNNPFHNLSSITKQSFEEIENSEPRNSSTEKAKEPSYSRVPLSTHSVRKKSLKRKRSRASSQETLELAKQNKEAILKHYKQKHTKWAVDSDTENSDTNEKQSTITKLQRPQPNLRLANKNFISCISGESSSDNHQEISLTNTHNISNISVKARSRKSASQKGTPPSLMVTDLEEEENSSVTTGVKKYGCKLADLTKAHTFHGKRTNKDLYLKWRSSFLNGKGGELLEEYPFLQT